MKIQAPFLRSGFNYDRDQVSDETGLACPADESMTQQQFKEESDINEILRRFGITGELPENPRLPQSGDFTGITDFKTAMDAIAAAQSGFMELPADLRARFKNDPQQLLEFLENDKNKDEAIELGLVNKPPERTRDMVQAVDDLAAKLVPATPPQG